jgi:uncharacterized protein (TIGR02246 family)
MLGILAIAVVGFWLPAIPPTNSVSARDSVADVLVATSILKDFQRAWDGGDGAKLGSLFTTDGDLVIPTGECFRGRDAISGFYNSAFARGYRGSRTTAALAQIRHVTSDVMIADATWEISGAVSASGVSRPAEHGILAAVLQRVGGRWRVAALREQTSATRLARQ